MANNPTDRGPLLPTRNVYVINSAAELPQVLSQYVIYNLQYDPGDGIGLYFSPDGATLERIGAGGGGGAPTDATYVTVDDETGDLPNSVTVDTVAYPPQLGFAQI